MADLEDWLKQRLRESLCVLSGGHNDFFKQEHKRVFLECSECGRQTPGWDLSKRETRIVKEQPVRETIWGYVHQVVRFSRSLIRLG